MVLSPEPASVVEARNAVTEIAARSGAREEDVRLAVSEAVGNAVVHAFRGDTTGTIIVSARPERGRLLVTVRDDGIGMTPNPDSPGLGFGIALIGKLADDVRFSSSGEGTVISMCFNAPALPPGADEAATGKGGVKMASSGELRIEVEQDAGPRVADRRAGDRGGGSDQRRGPRARARGGRRRARARPHRGRVHGLERAAGAARQGRSSPSREFALVLHRGSPVLRLIELSEVQDRIPWFESETDAVAAVDPADGADG